MQFHVGTTKVPKFGFLESGDTVEVVERPRGGWTAILADGQGHGRAAKRTSAFVAAKAVALIADGARDGAVARAVHDYLYALRDGKVSATLVLISVDLRTRTLVISRNSHCPVFIRRANGEVEVLDAPVEPIGVHLLMKPAIDERPLEPGTVVLTFTDGIMAAGARQGEVAPLAAWVEMVRTAFTHDMAGLAEQALAEALRRDENRPSDDMAALALAVDEASPTAPVRRMSLSTPL